VKFWQNARALSAPASVLLIADLVVISGALLLALLVRFSFDFEAVRTGVGPVLPRALTIAVWVMVGLASMGMYRHRQRPRPWEVAARAIVGVLIGGLCSVLFFYIFPLVQTGRGVMGLGMLLAIVGLTLERWWLLRMFDLSTAKRRVLVLGSGKVASRIASLRRRADRRRFEIVGYSSTSDADRRSGEDLGLTPLVEFADALREGGFDEIVVAQDDRRGNFPTHELLEQRFRGVRVTEVVEFLERETEKIHFDVMQPGWLVFSSGNHAHPLFLGAKRLFDLVVSIALLALISPILLLTVLAIKLEDGFASPVLYRQQRVGLNDRVFELLKFRSMGLDAEAGGARWWSGAGDARVTRVGRVLRRVRLDEVPQLVNVIRGDMSIVGPRPERPEFVEDLIEKVPYYNYRHSVRPGLTGWAQLNFPYGSSTADARNKLAYDLYYIKNASLVFDMFVFLQTVEVVLWGRAISMAGPGSDNLADAPSAAANDQSPDLQPVDPSDRNVA
jgi:sugar transferase (PEP-CTERM system associated)